MVAAVTLVVAAVGIVGPHVARLDTFVIQSPPDLAALFAVGILSAGIVGASTARRSWPWAWLALAAAAPVLATIWWQGSVWTLDHLFWVDLALGPAIACLLAALATGRPAPLLRLLDARPIRSLGSSSYSLYLTHAPIVVDRLREDRGRPGPPGRPGLPRLARPRAAADDRVRAALRVGLRDAVPAAAEHVPRAPRLRLPRRAGRAGMSRDRVGMGPLRRSRRGARRRSSGAWAPGPFLDGVRTIDAQALAAAAGIALLTTVCCAWRWKTVAGGLGVDLSLPAAVAAYYRSQFLNVTLPGGVVGDVHRGVSHGRDVRDVGRGLRAVAWERSAGQVVQVVLTVVVLLVLPSPVHSAMPLVAIAAVVATLVVVLVARARPGGDRSVAARVRTALGRDIRDALLARGAWLRHRARIRAGRRRPRGHVPDRRADRRHHRAAVADAADRAARDDRRWCCPASAAGVRARA